MLRGYSQFLPHSARSLARLAILLVFAISLLALVGWVLDTPLLKSIKPQWIRMSFITATCLILSAIQLALLQIKISPSNLRRFMVLIAPAIVVVIVGLLTTVLYFIAMMTGQEPLLSELPVLNLFWTPATRIALLTAILFLLTGCALVLLSLGGLRAANIAHALTLPAAMASYLVPVSYLLGVQAMHGWLGVPVALNTGIAFCTISVAIFCVRPDTWLMRVITDDRAGGVMARRLLPALLMIPLLIGWLHLSLERAGALVAEVNVALAAVAFTFSLFCLVWLTAVSLNRADSKRQLVEGALRSSRERSRLAFENANIGMAIVGLNGRYLQVNNALSEMFGYSREELQKMQVRDLTYPDDLQLSIDFWLRTLRGEIGSAQFEKRKVHRDGTIVWVNIASSLVRDLQGKPLYFVSQVQDITARKQAEEVLRKSEARLAEAQRIAHLGNYEWDIARDEITLTDEGYRIFGLIPHEFIPSIKDFLRFVHPDDLPAVKHQLEEAKSSGVYGPIDYRIVGQDDLMRFVHARGETCFDQEGQPLKMLGTLQDITERKQAEEDISRQAELLDLAFDAIFVRDLQGRIVYWNHGAEEIYGWSREEALGQVSHALLDTSFPQPLEEIEKQLVATGRWEGELRHRTRDGRRLVLLCRWALQRGDVGRPSRVLEINTDISASQQAEEALRESEERFRTMANAIPQLAWIAENDGYIYWYNQRWYDYTGTTPEDMKGWGWQSVHDPQVLPQVLKRWKASLATDQPFDMVFPLRGANGQFRQFLTRVLPFKDANGQVVKWFGTNTDITERQQMEEALRQARDGLEQRVKERTAELEKANRALRQSRENLRFLTFKTLTAQEDERKRIAYELHEGLGQSLTALKLQLRTIQKMMPPSGPQREEFETTLNYMTSIVEDVRRLSKGLSPLMLEDLGLLTGLRNLFEETCKLEGVECSFEIDDIESTFSSEAQVIIYRVCQEILNNTIKHAQASQIKVRIQKSDGQIQLSVTDNGKGFEVDQTLTSSLKDRGVGLAYMQEQVRMLGGTISISSKIGEGTRINITVP